MEWSGVVPPHGPVRGRLRVERCGIPVSFAVREYALVFGRATGAGTTGGGHSRARPAWRVVRPRYRPARAASVRRVLSQRCWPPAELLVVPVCSALALDTPSYESFLRSSGVLDEALDLLRGVALTDATAVETARRRIHSLVMAAEVQHIVDRLSA